MSEDLDQHEQLHNLLSEHFDACVLVGYDLKTKERVQINNYESTMQRDALATILADALQDFSPVKEVIALIDPEEDPDE